MDVNALGCSKLTDRAVRITMAATRLTRPAADELLARADWHVKTAIIMQRLGMDAAAARARLDASGGNVRRALETPS